GGMEKVFEINRNFRNEGISLMHNPEFTMVEFYELYRDAGDFMDLSEQLLLDLAAELLVDNTLEWQGHRIALAPPFRRVKFMEAIAQASGLALEQLWDEAAVRAHIAARFAEEALPPTFGKMLELLFDAYVEKTLIEPTFVTGYPKIISPLSKASRADARETERFELYVAGMEIANGFSELNDPLEQRRRFEEQARDRERGDDEAQRIDNGFLQALEHGMAPAAGEGIGIDRLVMLFTGAASIKEVILFPLLRPRE
ncbi:MAG: lysine--tRNA ligase, partial [Acidobacteria bacterium]|nr:lysine--tRNA ligase [Acidobacteriota bacterium]